MSNLSGGFTDGEWWSEEGGFFGRCYMDGDNSKEGYLSIPQSLTERTGREVEGVTRLLRLKPGQHVLDCPCGYGRHSIGLAQGGMHVVGVDINSYELDSACREAAGIEQLQFIKTDMRALEFDQAFDVVINMFLSFGFFDSEEDNSLVLQKFFRALKPGGRFLMHTDVNTQRIASRSYKFYEKRHLQGGRKLEIIESYNQDCKRLEGRWRLIDSDGAKDDLTPYSVRVYSFAEFSELCRQVGFHSIQGYGNWEGGALSEASEEMIVVAVKSGG